MSTLRNGAVLLILAGIILILAVPFLVGRAPASLASLPLGTDDAFAVAGLEPRENLIGGGALRWTRPQAAFRFEGAGPGLVEIEVDARDHRNEVVFTANGAEIGRLPPGARHVSAKVKLGGRALDLGLATEGFQTTDRRLGTQVVSIRVTPMDPASWHPGDVPMRLWRALGAVFVAALLAQALFGLNLAAALLTPGLLLVLVLPAGLWRSAWLNECAALLTLAFTASAFVSARSRGTPGARAGLQIALIFAVVVHGLLPPSPLVVQGDAQLHGNKLGEVARGDLFPTSRTDHKPPFAIPYGFSFYGVLTPWAEGGVTNVSVVREGAAFFSALSAIALTYLIGLTSAPLAAASAVLWTFAPVNLRTMGYGNLSNVFAQAVLVLFLAAAASIPKGVARALILGVLVAVSATAHLSSFIVLLTLTAIALAIPGERRDRAFGPLLGGILVACAYYTTFLPMIVKQIPRLLAERGGSVGVFDPWRLPSQILAGAGWPLLVLVGLALLGLPMRAFLPLSRSLAIAGLLLATAALVSPVEVRYLLAVLPLFAVTGGRTLDSMDPKSFAPSLVLRTTGAVLLLAAAWQGVRVLFEFMPLVAG